MLRNVYGVDTVNIAWFKDYRNIIDAVIKKEYQNQINVFLELNKKLNYTDDIWVLYFVVGQSLKSVRFDFSPIKIASLKAEVKLYFQDKLKNRIDFRNVYTGLPYILRGMEYFISNYVNVYCSADISPEMVKSLITHLQVEARNQHQRRLAVSSQADVLQHLKLLIDFIMDNHTKIGTPKPIKNYFEDVSYHNLENMKEKTEYIPEEVVEQLLYAIDDLNSDYQRILLTMMNSGLRYKEVQYLDYDCIKYDAKENVWILKFIPWKVLESRRHHGLSDYHEIVINETIAQEINKQRSFVKELMLVSGLNHLFIHEVGGYKVGLYDSRGFNNAVNRIIKKHNIKTKDGELWKFTSKQCRKTFAVDAITNGAKPIEISYMLGHNSEYTTHRYYAEVRQMKLAQLNAEFFKKRFELLITEEQLSRFDEEERKVLFVDFCLNEREVELGKCLKPLNEPPCNRETGKIECANCKNLCTGLSCIDKWTSLRDSKKKELELMREAFAQEGIVDYEDYRDYQRTKYSLNSYQAILDKMSSVKG